ncbi:class I SAM-dependent methyltransferase [Luteococcus sp. Sow4_B9]|uniref:class I SAM-dependent methyltransferase n=1 Tax=Luteococcus sp. Sow4_B9 TaxID=3438792 RepID=UPI003F962554
MSVCPFCSNDTARRVSPAAHPNHSYLVCRRCRAGRLDPMPPEPETFYDADYFIDGGAKAGYPDYEADEPWHRRTARARLARLEATAGPQGWPEDRVLCDVGAATGFLLDEARLAGWRGIGVEPSSWAAAACSRRGLPVVPSLAEVPEPVDAITFFQSLEHMPDPLDALAQAAHLLRPGGSLVCETWDASSVTAKASGNHWQQLSPPSVLWLLTRPAVEKALAEAGLVLTSWRATPKVVSLSTVVGQSVERGGRRSIPHQALRAVTARVPVPYFLDDLVTFTARHADAEV